MMRGSRLFYKGYKYASNNQLMPLFLERGTNTNSIKVLPGMLCTVLHRLCNMDLWAKTIANIARSYLHPDVFPKEMLYKIRLTAICTLVFLKKIVNLVTADHGTVCVKNLVIFNDHQV